MIPDAEQRHQARNPMRSVIVQAPAGSGKTELLMQRYLALLDTVDEPEQILAVTFTRKAAAEMRHRILSALQYPDAPDRLAETAILARAVLMRDRQRNWRLLDCPARLRIKTFDSVNAWLVASSPLGGMSGAGIGQVSERPDDLYTLAARRTLEHLTEKDAFGPRLRSLLLHLDNRADTMVQLLASMLARRDQWLPLLGSGKADVHTRELLESSLAELVRRELRAAAGLIDAPMQVELVTLLDYAANMLRDRPELSFLACWHGRTTFPDTTSGSLSEWRALANFMLTKNTSGDPTFRSRLDKNLGFPPPAAGGDADMKARATSLLEACAGNTLLAKALGRIRDLPEPAYSASQWEALQSLIAVLPLAAAQLLLVFREQNLTDYIEIANRALASFGADDEPADLALRLDYSLRHILVDEFQDTSRSQYTLLERLTAGWSGEDGRTLMVVGDPMQSIYRFRQAEVGLFAALWHNGIGSLKLEPLTLSVNFRSDPAIVGWVNERFTQLMPAADDVAAGTVRFARGEPCLAPEAGAGVRLHWLEQPGRRDEADLVASLVADALRESPTSTVGILVRSRRHARLIAPALRSAGIAFSGQGLEYPGETAVEQDLIALTRAICHPADRTAWLAMLRAPWCGLTLEDLECLCGDDWTQPVLQQMTDPELVAGLSVEGRERLQAFYGRLERALTIPAHLPLRDRIEGAWQLLGGPALLASEHELSLARLYFDALDEMTAADELTEPWLLHGRLPERPDMSGRLQPGVSLLTIFKAKGLEYDTVIVPGVDCRTRGNAAQALLWHEFQGAGDRRYVTLAPIAATGSEVDPVQALLQSLEREQFENELKRLMYVASTRARKKLHILAQLKRNSDGQLASPGRATLLSAIWPAVQEDAAVFQGSPGTPESRSQRIQQKIWRFRQGWSVPPPPATLHNPRRPLPADSAGSPTYDWVGMTARHVGSVVHRCLQHLADADPLGRIDEGTIAAMLREEGVPAESLRMAMARVAEVIAAVQSDVKGRWILQSHTDSANELPVIAWQDGSAARLVIDRTFVDADGVRWIIDYKTSQHQGGDLQEFLDRERARYRPQLGRYADAMQALEPDRIVRAALYFPLQQAFCEIDLDADVAQIDPAS